MAVTNSTQTRSWLPEREPRSKRCSLHREIQLATAMCNATIVTLPRRNTLADSID